MLVTELETKEILPNRKLVPMFISMALTKVSSSTGISAQVWLVSASTLTTMAATMTMMTLTSLWMISAS